MAISGRSTSEIILARGAGEMGKRSCSIATVLLAVGFLACEFAFLRASMGKLAEFTFRPQEFEDVFHDIFLIRQHGFALFLVSAFLAVFPGRAGRHDDWGRTALAHATVAVFAVGCVYTLTQYILSRATPDFSFPDHEDLLVDASYRLSPFMSAAVLGTSLLAGRLCSKSGRIGVHGFLCRTVV